MRLHVSCIIHENKKFISIPSRPRNIQPIVHLYRYELGHRHVKAATETDSAVDEKGEIIAPKVY